MTTLSETPANRRKRAQARQVLEEVLAQALRHGFFGTVAVEITVQDGTVQRVRSRLERDEK